MVLMYKAHLILINEYENVSTSIALSITLIFKGNENLKNVFRLTLNNNNKKKCLLL